MLNLHSQTFIDALEQIAIGKLAKYRTHNLDIWSHCLRSFVRCGAIFFCRRRRL